MNDPHAPLQHHRGHLRLGWRVVVTVLIVIAVFAVLGISAVRRDAIDLLNPEAIRELLTVCGVVVVVALVGVYSVMVDFVFWEGWMEGLPDPNHLFPDDPEGECDHVISSSISMAFTRARRATRPGSVTSFRPSSRRSIRTHCW